MTDKFWMIQFVCKDKDHHDVVYQVKSQFVGKVGNVESVPIPSDDQEALEDMLPATHHMKTRKEAKPGGKPLGRPKGNGMGGKLQRFIRAWLRKGPLSKAEIRNKTRDAHMSDGNIYKALAAMAERGEVRIVGNEETGFKYHRKEMK